MLRFSLRPRMSGMAKSLRGKCVSWLTSVARDKHAARAPGIEVAVTGRAGRVQGRHIVPTRIEKTALRTLSPPGVPYTIL